MTRREEIQKRISELEPIVTMARYYWIQRGGMYCVYNSKTRKEVLETPNFSDAKTATLIANNNVSTDHFLDVRGEYSFLKKELERINKEENETRRR